jgi:hypothetical protein
VTSAVQRGLRIGLQDRPVLADDGRCPARDLPILAVDAEGLRNARVGVGDQREADGADLVRERLLVLEGVDRAARDADARFLEPVEPCLELEDLARSAGGVGLEVEEQD